MKIKKILSISLAAAVTFTTLFSVYVPAVYAASKPKLSIQNDNELSLNKKESKSHEVLVEFSDSKPLSKTTVKSRLSKNIKDISVKNLWSIKKSGSQTVTIALVRSDKLSSNQLLNSVKRRSDVKTASFNYKRKIQNVDINDEYLNNQWGFNNIDTEYQWENGSATADDAVVAIVDTGVDYTHEDLEDVMWENTSTQLKGFVGYNFNDGNTDPMDNNGHGTHVAGIIGAESDNGKGISGIAQDVKIMALKALDSEGYGWDSSLIAAYNYISKAQDLGVNIVAVNNSWGGYGENPVLTNLINTVGKKGAVSVCAAGNEGENLEHPEVYPADTESDYVISVGAINEDNTLASYSNYGNMVDVAAPGSNILSTVPYGVYNPTIYAEDQREDLTSDGMFADFDHEGFPVEDYVRDANNPNSRPIYTSYVKSKVSSDSGNALKLTTTLKANQFATFEIPYTLEDISSDDFYKKELSMMVSTDSTSGEGLFLIASGSENDDILTVEDMSESAYSGTYIWPDSTDYSEHITMNLLEWDDPEEYGDSDRKLTFMIYAPQAGEYSVIIDDFGISKAYSEDEYDEMVGCYDFMSGTSMATPYISAAVALKSAELNEDKKMSAADITTKVIQQANSENSLRINNSGSFSFSETTDLIAPRISGYSFDYLKKTLTFKGVGFDSDDLNVSAENFIDQKTLDVISKTKNKVVVDAKDVINNSYGFAITGDDYKTTKTNEMYCVKGKKLYDKSDISMLFGSSQPVTDGKKFYAANSDSSSIIVYDQSGDTDYISIDPENLFKASVLKDSYDVTLSDTIAYANGYIYAICEVGDNISSDDMDEDIYSDDIDEDVYRSSSSLFSSTRKVIKVNTATGKVSSLGYLPDSLKDTIDITLTAYNGEIYFIGGYNKNTKNFSTSVISYNPETKKYSTKAKLPEGRANGVAVQTGSKIVYAYGASNNTSVANAEHKAPGLLIYNGKSWKKSKTELPILEDYETEYVLYGKKYYEAIKAPIGIIKNGVMLMGVPYKNYGDNVFYDMNKDKYSDSGLSVSLEYPYGTYNGLVIGNKAYIADEMTDCYKKATLNSSYNGLVKAVYNKNTAMAKKGTVKGVNTYVAPGNNVPITFKAKKGYAIKEVKIGNWTKKYTSYKKTTATIRAMRLTSDRNVYVSYVKIPSKNRK